METRNDTKIRPKRIRQLPKQLPNLCIICLTGSSSMVELSENFEPFKNISIIKVLENVMSCVIEITDKTPSHICSMCMSLLRISYELQIQFDKTHQKIFGKEVLRNKIVNVFDPPALTEVNGLESSKKNNSEVDIIVGKENYNLSDILIVEEEENNEDYSKFFANLGKNVTVEYLHKESTKPQATIGIFKDEEKVDSIESNVTIFPTDCEENEPEEYETIVIQTASDNDDNLSHWEHEYAKNLPGKKTSDGIKRRRHRYPAALMKEINSLIIEGDGKNVRRCDQDEISDDHIDDSREGLHDDHLPSMKEPKRRKRNTAVEREQIEKYILYGDGKMPTQQQKSAEVITVSNDNGDELVQVFDIENYSNEENGLNIDSSLLADELVLEALNTKNVCKECSMVFATRLNLRKHMHTVHGQEDTRFKYKKMTKEAKMARRIEKLKSSYDRNKFLCQLCGYISKSSGGAKYHSLTHGEKAFSCEFCPKKYYTPTHLKVHYEYKHASKKSRHLCPLCGEWRNSASALNYHMKLHNSDMRRFPCSICGIKFTARGALTIHLRRHNGDRRYPCKYCNKSFFSSNELKKHHMIHTGERPYPCKYCNKSFISTFNRKVHMLTHDGPFLCEYCHKGFVDVDMLNVHLVHKHRVPSGSLIKFSQSDQEEESNEGQLLDELDLLPLKEEDNLDFEGD